MYTEPSLDGKLKVELDKLLLPFLMEILSIFGSKARAIL
jgi:hypothetical protein